MSLRSRKYENRMVALSDGVFSLAIAILLITSSVPNNFEELKIFLNDIPAFGVCIVFIYWIWNEQNRAFEIYDNFSGVMNFLNLLVLFGVLVYVYPLKFLMKWLSLFLGSLITGSVKEDYELITAMISMREIPYLMIIYGLGFVFIFFCLYLMHWYGMKQEEFNNVEEKDILRVHYHRNQVLASVLIGIFSITLAGLSILIQSAVLSILAGIAYNLHWPTSIYNNRRYDKAVNSIK